MDSEKFAKQELSRRGVQTGVGELPFEDGDVVFVRDIAHLLVRLRALEESIEESNTDPVTRLPVRRVLDRAYTRAFDRSRRHGIGLAVVIFDVDNFKAINDQHGHPVGDLALQHAGELIRATARAHDFVGRYGGDEIVVLMEGASAEDAQRFAQRAINDVRSFPCPVEGMTMSAGYAVLTGHETPDALLAQADRGLYRAKAEGRDRARQWCHPAGDAEEA